MDSYAEIQEDGKAEIEQNIFKCTGARMITFLFTFIIPKDKIKAVRIGEWSWDAESVGRYYDILYFASDLRHRYHQRSERAVKLVLATKEKLKKATILSSIALFVSVHLFISYQNARGENND